MRPGERLIGLDLMRSIAVLLVMVSHYTDVFSYWLGVHAPGALLLAGGPGVDLFFGLSGFLIGGILLDIIAEGGGGRALLRFWVRRWMRTLPIYWLWLCVLMVFFPPARHPLAHFLQFATMTQNLTRPLPEDFGFAVSWSLPIEEWFYFLFGGAVVFAALVFGPRRGVFLTLALFLLLPFLARVFDHLIPLLDGEHFKMVPYRLDEIAYGVVVAALARANSPIIRYRRVLLCLGLCLLGGDRLLQWLHTTVVSVAVYSAVQPTAEILGPVLCLPAAIALTRLPPVLAWLARTISRQSYALYLVHLTLLIDVVQAYWWHHRAMTVPAMIAAVILPFLVAELLSRFVEQPIMRLRPAQFTTTRQPRVGARSAEDTPLRWTLETGPRT